MKKYEQTRIRSSLRIGFNRGGGILYQRRGDIRRRSYRFFESPGLAGIFSLQSAGIFAVENGKS